MRRTTTTRALALLGGGGPRQLGIGLRRLEGSVEGRLPRPGEGGLPEGQPDPGRGVERHLRQGFPRSKLSDPEIDSFVRQTVIPTLRDQVRQLRALPPPTGKKGKVEEIYRALEKGLDELDKSPKRLIDGSNPFGRPNSWPASTESASAPGPVDEGRLDGATTLRIRQRCRRRSGWRRSESTRGSRGSPGWSRALRARSCAGPS